MSLPFQPAVDPPPDSGDHGWWFAFREDRLLVREDGAVARLPDRADLDLIARDGARRHYLGRLADDPCYALDLPAEAPLPEAATLHGLRALHGRLADELFAVAGRAAQILTWDRTHQYCGRCGTPVESMPGERGKRCPACGLVAYPRLSPAVIVLVTRPGQILLARGRQFAEGMYSTPAGFVEPGESLEEAVEREIGEEVGVRVRDIRYFGSQPWPFPHQLMVGFTAIWAEGEIRIDEHEIADARWFTRDAMPRIPTPISISRRLIDSFLVGEHG